MRWIAIAPECKFENLTIDPLSAALLDLAAPIQKCDLYIVSQDRKISQPNGTEEDCD